MTKLSIAALAAVLVAAASPVFAKTDCDAGFKSFLSSMSTYIDKNSSYDLADAIRRSLDAYDTCKSGDSFSPHGVWDQILADMKAKAGK
jgi:hypothetical protein